jgi:O-antigen ligase
MYLLSTASADIGFEAKNLVGSQRYGFIYLVAFWLVYLEAPRSRAARITRYAMLLVLVSGLLLTFSRSSVVALLVPAALFALSSHGGWLRRPNLSGVLKVGATIVGVTALILVVQQMVPIAFLYLGERLFGLLSDSDVVVTRLLDPRESEGTRVLLARQILDFVASNPLIGSGYLGVWVLPRAAEHSAHNQYLDVLFRTGLLGFTAYAYLILRIVMYLARFQRPLFWGFMSVLVYGLFHETFKESQGAFVLAFLLGMMAQAATATVGGTVPAVITTPTVAAAT